MLPIKRILCLITGETITRKKKYVVDEIIEQVLRLPPYRCIFNAIEMVWSQAKRSYDKEIIKPNMDPIKAWTHGLEHV
jgi:transposase